MTGGISAPGAGLRASRPKPRDEAKPYWVPKDPEALRQRVAVLEAALLSGLRLDVQKRLDRTPDSDAFDKGFKIGTNQTVELVTIELRHKLRALQDAGLLPKEDAE